MYFAVWDALIQRKDEVLILLMNLSVNGGFWYESLLQICSLLIWNYTITNPYALIPNEKYSNLKPSARSCQCLSILYMDESSVARETHHHRPQWKPLMLSGGVSRGNWMLDTYPLDHLLSRTMLLIASQLCEVQGPLSNIYVIFEPSNYYNFSMRKKF